MSITIWLLISAGVLLVGVILLYNQFVTLTNGIENGYNQVLVQLKRRHDLIPNLVEAVKDFMNFEEEVLTKVMEARSRAMQAETLGEKGKSETALSQALARVFGVMENYPDLKSNQRVSALMEELISTENRIAFARQYFNDLVYRYNNLVQMFPSSIVARIFGFPLKEYLTIETQVHTPPTVDLRP